MQRQDLQYLHTGQMFRGIQVCKYCTIALLEHKFRPILALCFSRANYVIARVWANRAYIRMKEGFHSVKNVFM